MDVALLNVLVVNAGSTSLKLHLVSANGGVERLDSIGEATGRIEAVAHRVVHGGPRFREPVVIDAEVRAQIFELEPLAPLHNAPALRGIEAAEAAFPRLPQVAVFDTAFHATIPAAAATYALPKQWRDEWGVHRYGFHGLSVQWAAEQVRVPRLVVCHLGGGCSVTAVLDGRSVDTTMGFSPLEGVPMATRSGSIDPGALIYVLREQGLGVDALDRALNTESGLKGLAGGSGDMRQLEQRMGAGDSAAQLAFAVFVHRVAAAVGAMSVATHGLDALVFTAGIGEGSALVRSSVCEQLGYLGVGSSAVRVEVVQAREELVAARAAVALLS
ncbi:MAG TPA: acetate/propionate family kinase [Gaiellaceae bacterium]|nr:acetate/propionate family kinase [Gaiellaceae bacterium]